MSEVNTPRLMAAAKEFNIGTSTLVDFLVSKGFSSDELKPTSKLSEPMYRVLQSEFQQDKAAKQKAEQVELSKGSAELKKKKDEEDLSIKKKEAAKPKAEEPKPAEPVKPAEPEPVVAVVEKKEEAVKAEVTKIDAPEIEAPKVLDKIDLDSIDSSTRPKKSTKKKEEEAPKAEEPKVQEPKKGKKITPPEPVRAEVPVVVPPPVVAEPPVENLPPVIENIQADKLTGPKILGKIQLPVDNDTRPKRESEDKRKRKRIPIEKKGGQQGGGQGGQHQQGQGGQQQQRPQGQGHGGPQHGGGQGPNTQNRRPQGSGWTARWRQQV